MKLNYFPNNVISQIIFRFQPQNLFNLLASSSANLVDYYLLEKNIHSLDDFILSCEKLLLLLL